MTDLNLGRVEFWTGPAIKGGFVESCKWENVIVDKVMGPTIDLTSLQGQRHSAMTLPLKWVNWDGMAHILGYRRWSHLKRERATWKPYRRKRHHALGGRR